MQPLSKDDSLWRILPGHPDGHEQGSHQGHLKVAVVFNQLDDGATQLDVTMMMTFSCRTYTMTSMSDGSSSTIMVEEWQPIFDRFDLESDGRMVSMINTIDTENTINAENTLDADLAPYHQDGKIPLDRFAAILEVILCVVESLAV